MIIYIYGEDTFLSHQYLTQQIDRFKKERDPQGMNVVIVDGIKEEADRLWVDISASPFLAEKRLIVIQNLLTSKRAETLESFVEGISRHAIPEQNVVIFWQGQPAGKSKIAQELHKILAKEKWAKEFVLLSGAALSAWVKNEITTRGGSIAAPAVQYLLQHASIDMWHLHSLVDQLIAYAAGTEISLAHVQLFLEEKVDDNIFNMVDAVVSGNKKLAFTLLEKQRRMGEDDGYIFSMILRQFRILVSMRDLFDVREQISSSDMATELKVHPFVVKKSLPLIKKYSLEALKNIYYKLLEIDIKTKTGFANQSWLIDLFVGNLQS